MHSNFSSRSHFVTKAFALIRPGSQASSRAWAGRRRWIGTTLSGAVLVFALTGCMAVVVPVPTSNRQPVGQPIGKAETAFIVPDQTTREQVVQRFGSDFRQTPRHSALAYSWELPGGNTFWMFASTGGGAAGEAEWTHWRALFLQFDERGVVTRKKFVHLSTSSSLDDQIDCWAKRGK
jgi:hypothetical protein